MPAINIDVTAEQHAAFKAAALASGLSLAAWMRFHLLKVAAATTQPAAPKPVGRPGLSMDDFLDRFADERFPSGQRRYRYLVSTFPDLADDEAFHRVYEAARMPGRGKPDSWDMPMQPIWDYVDKKRHSPI